MNTDDHFAMCACLSSELKAVMSEKEFAAATEKTPYGYDSWRKMLTYVYGPCLQFPVRAITYDRCKNNHEYKPLTSDITKTCTCLAERMANYAYLKAPEIIALRVEHNPYYKDPLEPFMSSAYFLEEHMKGAQSCLNK